MHYVHSSLCRWDRLQTERPAQWTSARDKWKRGYTRWPAPSREAPCPCVSAGLCPKLPHPAPPDGESLDHSSIRIEQLSSQASRWNLINRERHQCVHLGLVKFSQNTHLLILERNSVSYLGNAMHCGASHGLCWGCLKDRLNSPARDLIKKDWKNQKRLFVRPLKGVGIKIDVWENPVVYASTRDWSSLYGAILSEPQTAAQSSCSHFWTSLGTLMLSLFCMHRSGCSYCDASGEFCLPSLRVLSSA